MKITVLQLHITLRRDHRLQYYAFKLLFSETNKYLSSTCTSVTVVDNKCTWQHRAQQLALNAHLVIFDLFSETAAIK